MVFQGSRAEVVTRDSRARRARVEFQGGQDEVDGVVGLVSQDEAVTQETSRERVDSLALVV